MLNETLSLPRRSIQISAGKPLEYMNNSDKTVRRTQMIDFLFGGKRKSSFKNETFGALEIALPRIGHQFWLKLL